MHPCMTYNLLHGHFSYKRKPTDRDYFAWVLALGWFVLFLSNGTETPQSFYSVQFYCLTLSIPVMVWLGHSLSRQRLSDVLIGQSGISRYRAGRVRKTVAWNEVKQIDFGILPTFLYYRGRAPVSYAVISRKNRFIRSGIVFDSSIDNLRQLLTLLNHYARCYNIPVKARGMYTAVTVGNIPLD